MRAVLKNPLLMLVAGFTIWAAAFILLYALQALGCAYGWGNAHRPILIGSSIICLAPLAALALWPAPASTASSPGLFRAARWTNRAALGAGVVTYAPVLFATTCL